MRFKPESEIETFSDDDPPDFAEFDSIDTEVQSEFLITWRAVAHDQYKLSFRRTRRCLAKILWLNIEFEDETKTRRAETDQRLRASCNVQRWVIQQQNCAKNNKYDCFICIPSSRFEQSSKDKSEMCPLRGPVKCGELASSIDSVINTLGSNKQPYGAHTIEIKLK